MNITTVDFVILNNASFKASVEFKEDDIPIDISPYTFYLQCRPGYQSSTVYFQLDSVTPTGGITTDPTAGLVTIEIPYSLTSTFTWHDAVYDMIARDPVNGTQLRVLEGRVYINFGATIV